MGFSRCDYCQKELNWFDNIPLLSFFLLLGRCRFCKKKISFQYPAVELAMGLAFLAVAYWVFGGAGDSAEGLFDFEKGWMLLHYLGVVFYLE